MKSKKLLLVISALFLGLTQTWSQLSSWTYRIPVSITENTGNDYTQIQVLLNVNTQAAIGLGFMKPDGSDIRFAKDCGPNPVLFNYWIESGINTPNTKIWVKMDTLLASETRNIYLYSGNPIASAVSSINGTFVGPHSATDSVSGANSGGVTDSQRGFRFSPNEDILVTSFGKNEPNGSNRTITLFDFNTQAILAQTNVPGPAAQYSYANISNPLWLLQGTQYLIQIYQGASDGYYYGAGPQIGQHLTYLDMRYCNGCGANTFPTSSLNGIHYGYVDFWYYTRVQTSVAPTVSFGTPAGSAAPLSLTLQASENSICVGESSLLNAVNASQVNWSNGANTDTTTVSPLNNTTYTAQGYGSDGCYSSGSITIEVNPLPSIQILASDTVICAGESVTLTASGADSYVWDNGIANGTAFSPAGTNDFEVTGTDLNACSNTATVTITVNPTPTVVANATSTLVCIGEEITLSGSGAETYVWNNGVSNGVPFAPQDTSTYTVTGTNEFNCSSTASITVNVICLGLDDTNAGNFSFYPNPSSDFVYFSGYEFKMNIRIFDMNGKQIGLFKGVENSIQMGDFPSGVYLIKIYDEADQVMLKSGKIVKQ